MADVSFTFSEIALDMTAINVFANLGDAIARLRSTSGGVPGFYATNAAISVNFARKSATDYQSARLGSDALNIKLGDLKLPGFEFNIKIPVSGTIDRIEFFKFKGFIGEFTGDIRDIHIDIAQLKKQVVDAYLKLPEDKYSEALDKAYAALFSGADQVYGSRFADKLLGFAGDDRMQGGAGKDLLDGGTGSDTLIGGAGSDILKGGESEKDLDVASYSTAAGRVQVGLEAGDKNREYATPAGKGYGAGDTLSDIEGLRGSAYNDVLRGDANANMIAGGRGDDLLFGRGGADRFAFTSSAGTGNVDTIADFDGHAGRAVIDRIELDSLFFALGTAPSSVENGDNWRLNKGEFYASADGAALNATTKLLYNTKTGELKYDADGTGGGEAVLVARIYDSYNARTGHGHAAQDLKADNFFIHYDITPDF